MSKEQRTAPVGLREEFENPKSEIEPSALGHAFATGWRVQLAAWSFLPFGSAITSIYFRNSYLEVLLVVVAAFLYVGFVGRRLVQSTWWRYPVQIQLHTMFLVVGIVTFLTWLGSGLNDGFRWRGNDILFMFAGSFLAGTPCVVGCIAGWREGKRLVTERESREIVAEPVLSEVAETL